MKTKKKNQFDFKKRSIVELNDNQLNDVNGGSSWPCRVIISFIITTIPGDQGPTGDDGIFENGFD